MLETIGIIFAVLVFLAVFSQMTDDQEIEKKKRKDELELKKMQQEYELEIKKLAGLNPLYQEQQGRLKESIRKNQQLKFFIIFMLICAVSILGYFLFIKNNSIQSQTGYVTSSTDAESEEIKLTENSQINETLESNTEDLPQRFVPLEDKTPVKVETSVLMVQKKSNPINEDIVNKGDIKKAEQISIYEAQSYIGQNTTVCGRISQISVTSRVTYINFGGRYPNQTFSGVIWSKSNDLPAENENVCINGLIESYKGIPQIIIQSVNNQISIH